MKPRELEKLFQNVTQVLTLTRTVNINKEAVANHASTMKTVRTKLDKYFELWKDQAYMKLLSPAESKCLQDNAQALCGTFQELTKELEYLDLSRQPQFVINAVNELNHAWLLMEWLIEEVGESGEIILPHLQALRPDKFDQGKYRNQIDSLYAELEAISHDFHQDHVQAKISKINEVLIKVEYPTWSMLIPICDHLVASVCWLKKEKERLKTEAIPDTKKIEIPAETTPDIPSKPLN
jgi:hypothetical protein